MASLATVLAAYETNAGYQENDSASEAAAFITACRKLLGGKLAQEMQVGGAGGERIMYNLKVIADQLEAAQRWVSTVGSTDVRYFNVSYYRQ